jgi:arabinofuranosyltransferase
VVGATVGFHTFYYTFLIGGDHFEYRIYSYLVPLLFLSTAGMLIWIGAGRRTMAAVLVAFALLSYPIPWTHWWLSKDLSTRAETTTMRVPIAGAFPAAARPIVKAWDRWQAELISHHVGTRHQEHKVFYFFLSSRLPPREAGRTLDWDQRIVKHSAAVGVVSWSFPNVAIIDILGLNDRIVARTPLRSEQARFRHMAHDRRPPPGYVKCFEPNLQIFVGPPPTYTVGPRVEPLSDEKIVECETSFFPNP